MKWLNRNLLVPMLFTLGALLWGCSGTATDTVTQGGMLAAETKAADMLIQSGEVESAVLSAEMTEQELATVVDAFDTYASARTTLKDLADNPAALINAVDTIRTQHDRVRDAYLRVQEVVQANRDQYTPSQQAQLERWQSQAERLEKQYQSFVQAVHTQMQSDARQRAAIELLRTVAQIALVAAA